jgi:hypothetical protein
MENGHEIETWNARSLYRLGPLKTVSRELAKYKLDLVGVQVRSDKSGTKPADDSVEIRKLIIA